MKLTVGRLQTLLSMYPQELSLEIDTPDVEGYTRVRFTYDPDVNVVRLVAVDTREEWNGQEDED